MYCPKCATANADEVKFCRSCGANLSLVPQALTGQLPESRDTRRRGRHRNRHGRDEDGPPNLGRGITQLIMGVGFLIAALAIFFSPGGQGWWWAMLFPGFTLLGKGIADIVTVRTAMNLPQGQTQAGQMQAGPPQAAMPPARNTGEIAPQQAYNPLPPPSVTEGTTRHLDPAKDRYDESR
jgi:hypothetical protein